LLNVGNTSPEGRFVTPPRPAARAFWLAAAVVITPIGVSAFVLSLRFSANVHTVESGVLYRSAWLWPGELQAVVEQYGIRSIVSLVPAEPNEVSDHERPAVVFAHSVVRYDMPLSSQKELTSDQLCALLALLRDAPKPVLIQSRYGADRSGLAAAIFEYAIAQNPSEATHQLSLRYGHFPYLLFSGTRAMDASFRRFVRGRCAESQTS
jgi:hypothetical protein